MAAKSPCAHPHLVWAAAAGGLGRNGTHRAASIRESPPVKNLTRELVRAAVSLAILLMVVGCASRPAPDFWGRWRPVNRYAEQPQAIPLQQQYLFYASPLDGTLKAMLTRWSKDARMTLSYQHPSDFTLHAAVAGIRTPDVSDAALRLSQAYAAQQVAIAVEGNRIVVRPTSAQAEGSADGREDFRSGARASP